MNNLKHTYYKNQRIKYRLLKPILSEYAYSLIYGIFLFISGEGYAK